LIDAQRQNKPYVTVVMPIRNEARFIERSLRAVLEQDYPSDRLEILVADGMSTDGTRDLVAALGSRNLRLISNPGAIVSVGLNRAIAEARGEVIVRVDGHTVIEPDYVSRCVVALQTSGADCVGGPMCAVGEGRFGKAVAAATSSPFGVGGARFHYSLREEWVDTVYLGAWWRTTFDRIGLFDETMVRDQDDEFNYRLLDAGGRILLRPEIRSRYIVRGTPRALWRQYFQYGFWKVRVIRKHPRQARGRQLVPSTFVLALILSGLAALIGPWGRTGFLVLIGSYGAASITASVWSSKRAGWTLLPGLALAYAIVHVGYGCGFLTGLASPGAKFSSQRQSVG
jgi:succinoglycan biosynthesis protein ExoA